ncbi:MAG: DMT family transporter [Oscillospiraceae bacterium]|nr:DMT family transporter [Oscillospiraceae bacterium]
MEDKKNDSRSVIMMVLSVLIFGTIGIFRRYIPLSSVFLAFARGMIGGSFLLSVLRLRKNGSREKLRRRDLILLILSGILIGINWMLLFEAYRYTTVAVATLCYYMQPTIVILASPFILGEKLTVRKAVCAAVAIAGMVLVSGVTGNGGHTGSMRGVFFGLGAAVFYASVILLNKSVSGVDTILKTTVQLLSAGAVMIPYILAAGGLTEEKFTPLTVALTLVVGIVHTGIAYVLYFGSMDGLKAQSVAILSYIDPVSALLFSALLLREPVSAAGVIGAVMIIGSALISEL